MADISKINLPNSASYNLKDSTARADIGTLSSLTTTAKTNLVAAINEINGTSGSAYTKEETDALLDSKADLVDGKVPASQLPSYVDDVLEYASTSAFPTTGESGKIYIATDTNKTYRWSGSTYVEISQSLALGETSSTAYAGNKGKANADAIAKKPGEITTGKQYTIDGQAVTASNGAETFNDLTWNRASGQYSHAEGSSTTASGLRSHAEGEKTTASGHDSHAEGFSTTASGSASHAEGSGTVAASQNQHVQGRYNVEDSSGTYAFIIGNGTGTATANRHNAFAIDWDGRIYVDGASTGVNVYETNEAVKSLVDRGAKNLLEITATSQTINGVSFTVNENKTVTVNGTATATTEFFVNPDVSASILRSGKFTGCPATGSLSTYLMMLEQKKNPYSAIALDSGSGSDLSYTGNINAYCYIQIKSGVTVNNLVFKPMICTAEDYAISPEFVPYAKSNYELTQDVEPIPSLVEMYQTNLSVKCTDISDAMTDNLETRTITNGYATAGVAGLAAGWCSITTMPLNNSTGTSERKYQKLFMVNGTDGGKTKIRLYSGSWGNWAEVP